MRQRLAPRNQRKIVMKKEIRETKEGIIQITTWDERWYAKSKMDEKTGLPIYEFVPSVTWIAGYYPKGIAFYKWLAQKGWDEAEAIKTAAGDKGSKVHFAITDLLAGKEVAMDGKYLNKTSGKEEELTLEEYECLMSFVDWFKKTKPKVLANELVVFNEEYGYAGTIDLIAEIDGEKYIIDVKTGANIWPEHELQISAYLHGQPEKHKLALLQLGYKRNKNGWKFTEIEDKFDLFLSARKIWQNECGEDRPRQKDFPLVLSLKEEKQKVADLPAVGRKINKK